MFKDKSAVESVKAAAPATVLAQSRTRRKRFLLVGTAALAAIAVAMGVSFLDSSGTASLSITSTTSNLVYPLVYVNDSNTFALPSGSDPLTTTAFSGASALTCATGGFSGTQGAGGATTGGNCSGAVSSNTIIDSNIVNPSWSPVAGSAGTVTTAGDLAIVDATTAPNYVTVNMYITNLAALAIDYSSFAFPINVYKTTCDSTGSCSAWSEVLSSPSYTYITDTSGALTFNLQSGAGIYYDIVMEGTDHTTSYLTTPTTGPTTAVGGSFYTSQTSTSPGSLSPSFYFTATSS